jgi:hypothetical protein
MDPTKRSEMDEHYNSEMGQIDADHTVARHDLWISQSEMER